MNYYDKNTPEFIPYTEQKIYNFEYNWIIPEKDETLLEMIRQWNAPNDFESIHKSYKDIDAITQRIKDLGGIHLIWV